MTSYLIERLKAILGMMLLVLVVCVVGYAGYLKIKNDRLVKQNLEIQSDLDGANSAIEFYRRANEIVRTQQRELQAQIEHWEKVTADLSTLEGRDEPLNPYERAVLDSVRNPRKTR